MVERTKKLEESGIIVMPLESRWMLGGEFFMKNGRGFACGGGGCAGCAGGPVGTGEVKK